MLIKFFLMLIKFLFNPYPYMHWLEKSTCSVSAHWRNRNVYAGNVLHDEDRCREFQEIAKNWFAVEASSLSYYMGETT